MRDNQERMPEILDAFQDGANFFGVVQIKRSDDQRQYRLGVSHDGYLALRRVLQLRPFDLMPGVKSRYFFVPATQLTGAERANITVRIEQGRDGRQMKTEAPRDLVVNLMWFYELEDWNKAEHLRMGRTSPVEGSRG